MKKVILINPPFNIAKANYDSSISVGLLSIATYLNDRGVKVELIDGARQRNYRELIEEKIGQADIAALSVMTTQIPKALAISRLIKQLNKSCLVIWGGCHPTFFKEQTVRHELVDIVCYGEGEETIYEISQGVNLTGIKGIVYKAEGMVKVNPPRPLLDPAKLPLFNWDLVAEEVLRNLTLVPSLTSRGCPHRCSFCINAILKNNWRPRTVDQVLADLKAIKQNKFLQGKKIRFWDENFFVDINRAKAIIDGMIERDLISPWETTVRANYVRPGMIDDGFMAKLRRSGCYLLSFGAESGSPSMLKKIQKDITTDEIMVSAERCLKHDIIPQYSFMIGLPGETKADMKLTLKLIDRLIKLSDRVQILGPQAFRPYPGSPLYEECLKAGWQEPESLSAWSNLVANELNYLDINNYPWIKDKAYVEAMEAYVRFGAHSFKSAIGSSVKAQRLLKSVFILICKLRWRFKFFAWPIEYKLAKKFVTRENL